MSANQRFNGRGATSADSPRWNLRLAEVFLQLGTCENGLTDQEARKRLGDYGRNLVGTRPRSDVGLLLLRQFASPIIVLLICAAGLSFFLEDNPTDSVIILFIIFVSGLLGFWQEQHASRAVQRLLSTIELKSRVIRDGSEQVVSAVEIVPGDILSLSAGAGVAADCRLISARDLFVDEAALTGETFPVEKNPAEPVADVPLVRRSDGLFLGTHVVSGSGLAVVIQTGRQTEFGAIAGRLRQAPGETDFERGVRRFGYFLVEITLILVTLIFCFNVATQRPVLDSFLFALALAVGLTPQLLPAIISVNLAHGAVQMAAQRVIVKRLAAIENFGCMDILCSDKTGTLTEGRVRIIGAWNANGDKSPKTLLYACVNSRFETGYVNPIDEALRDMSDFDFTGWAKLDEIPYDFVRKRLSVLAEHAGQRLLISKGAVSNMLDVCSSVRNGEEIPLPLEESKAAILQLQSDLAKRGDRTIGVAVRELPPDHEQLQHEDETRLTFLGLVAFSDPPKPGIADVLRSLKDLGIQLKIITGDSALVAEAVAESVGMANPRILCGSELRQMVDAALAVRVEHTEIFAEVEPNQKERIIRALRAGGHVVGYMGDGINDAPAMHAADVSVSVQSAVDVAKEAADIVLLAPDLSVLESGVRASRRTFVNTLKYVFMATSANFGNMFSMAGASFFLPFLPLLPQQILLMNLLTDAPELAIAGDCVDEEWIAQPRRWDIVFIRQFMCVFGLLSSLFDFLTFALLMAFLRAGEAEFRTGWFVESVASATLIVLVVRTRKPFLTSRPSPLLFCSSLVTVLAAVWLPYSPLASIIGFVPLGWRFLASMAGVIFLYVLSAEAIKRRFYARG